MKFDGDAKVISAAFVKARSEMSGLVAKDARGNYGKYMTLAALVEATAATFAQHGLAIVQEAGKSEMGVTVDTWLIHESGATMHFGTLTMPVGDGKPQTVGSALTYGRRYALAAVCGIAPDDDDGQAAQDSYKPRQAPQRAPDAAQGKQATSTPQGPQNGAVASTEDAGEGDAGSDELDKLYKRFHALGVDLFGDQWNTVRAKNAMRVSNGRTDSSKELTADEVQALVTGMVKVKAQRNAA